jgi:hypothetical protein
VSQAAAPDRPLAGAAGPLRYAIIDDTRWVYRIAICVRKQPKRDMGRAVVSGTLGLDLGILAKYARGHKFRIDPHTERRFRAVIA